MCDDCSDSTSTSDTSCDTSSDTSCDTSTDTSTDTTSELPEDTGDLSDDGVDELPDDSGDDLDCEETEADDCSDSGTDNETSNVSDGDEEISDSDEDIEESLPDDVEKGEPPVSDNEGLTNNELYDDGSEKLLDNDTVDNTAELPDKSLDDSNDEVIDIDRESQSNSSELTDNNDLGDDSSDGLPDGVCDKKTNDSVADYYSQHNYGQGDYDTYSKDPEWRQLMREQYPDVDLPPYSNFGEYYSAHNYGPQDYDTYSKDPDWQYLMSEQNAKAEYSDFLDNSPEAQELRDMGIMDVDLRECSPEYRGEIVNSVRDMYGQYPELRDQVRSVKCYEMSPGTYASYGPTKADSGFGGQLSINSTFFGSEGLRDKLQQDSINGHLVPGGSINGTISHELGHGLHLDMCAKNNGIEYGKIPDGDSYRSAVKEYIDDVHAKDIVDQACRDCGFSFYSRETPRLLSRYGASNYGEAFAEGISEANNAENPRPFAQAINNRYNQYKNNL